MKFPWQQSGLLFGSDPIEVVINELDHNGLRQPVQSCVLHIRNALQTNATIMLDTPGQHLRNFLPFKVCTVQEAWQTGLMRLLKKGQGVIYQTTSGS
jgi:hypothetical protein